MSESKPKGCPCDVCKRLAEDLKKPPKPSPPPTPEQIERDRLLFPYLYLPLVDERGGFWV